MAFGYVGLFYIEISFCRLSPKNLQQSSDLQFTEQSVNTKSTMEQGLHTVDFDPESQTKHY